MCQGEKGGSMPPEFARLVLISTSQITPPKCNKWLGFRQAGLCVVHQLRESQGSGDVTQPIWCPFVLVERGSKGGAHRRRRV